MGLYSFIHSRFAYLDFDKQNFMDTYFFEFVLDYLSIEIYKHQDELTLINSIDYLCSTLDEFYDEEYFLDLLIDFINSYNHFSKKSIVWIPTTSDITEIRFQNDSITFTGNIKRSKDNFLFLFNQLVSKGRKLYGKLYR